MLIHIDAPAKINLGLEVLYKRQDNYHEINTIFYRTCLADQITIAESDIIEINCIPSLNIPQEHNLAYKAALLLSEKYNIKKGAKITIEKRIPMGGGLGGGSSNAAAALKGLLQLWDIKATQSELMVLASELGSDVPFFIGEEACALGKGRGELLHYFQLDMPYWLLIVNPGIHISTPEAYKALNRTSKFREGSNLKEIIFENINKPESLKKVLVNDFEEFAFARRPELKELKNNLYKNKAAFALMSGSGSTIFALFVNENEAKKAATDCNGFFTHLCPPVAVR